MQNELCGETGIDGLFTHAGLCFMCHWVASLLSPKATPNTEKNLNVQL